MYATVEVVNAFLQVVPITVPRHTVHARGSHSFEFEITVPKHLRRDMVQQGGKPHLLIPLRCLSYASPSDASLARRCVRRGRVCSAFPLVDPLPSTGSADDDPSLFARFLGTMGPSDSLETCMSEVRRFAFSARPTLCGGVSWVSRFPCKEFPRMRRVFDSAASINDLRLSSFTMLPSPCQDKVGTPNF